MSNQIGIAVVGAGYWGMNYVRVLSMLPETKLVMVCDKSQERLQDVKQRFPNIQVTSDLEDVAASKDFDAAVVSTDATTHHSICRRLLEAGKHVLVEKPITTNSKHASELIDLADKRNLKLMVGHIFLFNPGIEKVKEFINKGEIGKIYYMYSRRTNMGPIRHDVNALWDLAPHDVCIFNYFMDRTPEWVSAVGAKFLNNNNIDAGFITLGYSNNIIGHIHVSWVDPNKEREVIVVGSNQRIAFNDLLPQSKVTVFEKGISASNHNPLGFGEFHLAMRNGDIFSPVVNISEPLKNQILHFINCVQYNKCPISDGKNGLDVIRVMEAIDASIDQNGATIKL
jgi:predicted dehydrogenase